MMMRFLRTFTRLPSGTLLLFLLGASVAMAGTRPKATAQTKFQQVGAAREVVLKDLPDLTAAEIAGFKQPPVHRNPHFTDAEYRAAKEAASHAGLGTRSADAANPLSPTARAQGTNTPGNFANFFGQNQGCNGSTWTPSDMGLAVGPKFIVQVVNECIAVMDKTGAIYKVTDLCHFVGLPPNDGTAGCFDPRATYDFVNNKFIVTIDHQDNAGNATIYVAASKTGNPLGGWIIHPIGRGPGLADFPTLGQTWGDFAANPSNSIVTVCDNFFGNTFFTDECLLLPKAALYAPGPFGFYFFFNFNLGGLLLDSIQPANVYEPGEKPRAQFAINTVNYDGTDGLCPDGADHGLVVWSFSNSVPQAGSPGPAASGIWTGCGSTSGYLFPGPADNAGFCSGCIETIDNRITGMVHYSAGKMFATIDTNNGGTSAVLGWTVQPFLDDNGGGCTGGFTNLCATLSDVKIDQEFCYDCGAGNLAEAFFGSIAPTPENNWTMYATFASSVFNLSPGQFYTSNRVTWETPFHDGGVFSCQNNAAYNQGRWGDYSAAAPDIPGVNHSPATWGSGMYIQPSGLWGTCISANAFVSDGDN
jgi:hypothetical protein